MHTVTHGLSCSINTVSPRFCYITITIPSQYVDVLYQEASLAQKEHISTYGFEKGTTPLEYVQEHYKNSIIEHISEFMFKYFVINFLYDQIHTHRLLLSGEPRLHSVTIENQHDAQFVFEASLATQIEFREWKNLPFKAPKRKNYKDIDRQVESFIKEEEEKSQQYEKNGIDIGDWVCFDLTLLSNAKKPILEELHKNLWLKIGSEEADIPFQELFIGHTIGEDIVSDNHCLQDYFSYQVDTHYTFGINISEIVPQYYFCFEDFKHHFKLKNQKEIHQKLTEIFSFRNDLSQRRNIIEEALKLLIAKHTINVPTYLILRQQKEVLEILQHNPDYQVYKTHKDFQEFIRLLALKQVKEMVLVDQLAHDEGIQVSNKDIKAYLNLFKRPRTKEFVYFQPPSTKIDGQEMPIPAALIKRNCLREKTLNHIIYHLTRK